LLPNCTRETQRHKDRVHKPLYGTGKNNNDPIKNLEYQKMTIKEIANILDARIILGENLMHTTIEHAFASDLMSDVLTLKSDNVLLITGLCNIQTLRTAEMSDIQCVIFAQKKRITHEMTELARENSIIVLECDYSVYKACGLLFSAGVSAIF